jgi:hypothetical protein
MSIEVGDSGRNILRLKGDVVIAVTDEEEEICRKLGIPAPEE